MKFVACCYLRYGVLILAVIASLASPGTVLAAKVDWSSVAPQRTNLKQPDFQSLGKSCKLEHPFYAPLFLQNSYVIDQPDGTTAYRGVDQPRNWTYVPFLHQSVWFCDKNAVEKKILDTGGEIELDTAQKYLVWALGSLVAMSATLAAWVIWLATRLLAPLLGVSSFITNPMVTTGWPFVLGIANIGFMLALLFIAFATTLRLESFGVRRMLPRLLIAALLINFSLVITGLLIDISRVVMAAIYFMISGSSNLDNLAYNLLEKSDLITTNFSLSTFKQSGVVWFHGNTNSWQTVASVMQAAVLMWGLAAGYIVLIGGLLARYIMLILLLIVSPLAFLAVALPNMGGLAQKWWSAFIKYVLFGPIMVFVLALTVFASQGLATVTGSFIASVLDLIVISAMMIAAVMAANKLGIMGAGATVNFASSQSKRFGRAGVGAGAWTSKKLIEKTELPRRISGAADSIARATGIGQISPYYRQEAQKQREKRAARQKTQSYGAGAAQEAYASPDKRSKLQAEASWVNEVKTAPADPLHAALAPGRLRNNKVAKEVNARQLRALADGLYSGDTSDEQLEVVVNSPDLIANMDVDTPQIIMTEVRNRMLNPAATADDKREASRLLEGLNRSIREAERRAREDSK